MSVWKKVVQSIVILLFTAAMFATVASYSLYKITDFENVNIVVNEAIKESTHADFSEVKFKEGIAFYKKSCAEGHELPDFKNERLLVDFTCRDVIDLKEGSGFNEIVSAFIEKEYYKERNCDFVSCVDAANEQDKLIVLVGTQKAHEFYKSLVIIFAAISAGLIAAYVFLTRKASSSFISVGISLLIVGIPSVALLVMKPSVVTLLKGSQVLYDKTVGILQASLWNMLLVGAGLIVLGILIRILEQTTPKETDEKDAVKAGRKK